MDSMGIIDDACSGSSNDTSSPERSSNGWLLDVPMIDPAGLTEVEEHACRVLVEEDPRHPRAAKESEIGCAR
jgi:hypothetical protein